MNILTSKKTNFVASKTLSFSIKFLGAATKQKHTMNQMKPYVEQILYDCIIPIMFITQKNIA